MRINKTDNAFQVYNKNQGVKKVRADKVTGGKDQLKISEEAIEFQYALSKLKDVEDMRMDKVEKIKEQMKSGTYVIDGNKIAEKIMDRINFDKKS